MIPICAILLALLAGAQGQRAEDWTRPLLLLSFSMDAKGENEHGHTTIEYRLFESGVCSDVRNVHNWAWQAQRRREVRPETVGQILEMVKRLPKQPAMVLPEMRTIVQFKEANQTTALEYDRTRLPLAMKRILELLGGQRFELEAKLRFLAEGAPIR